MFSQKKTDKKILREKLCVGISTDYLKVHPSLLQIHAQDFITCNSLPYMCDLKDRKAISCSYQEGEVRPGNTITKYAPFCINILKSMCI
jgi:hypothetical protein